MNQQPVTVDVEAKSVTEKPKFDVPKDPRGSMRLGLLMLLIGFGGFMIWAFLAPLDEGVPSHGTVIVDTKRKQVQHFSGGIVEEILVKEGQSVKKDQVLIRMLDTNSKSQLHIYQNQVDVLSHQVKSLRSLVDEGFYPKNQFMDMERQYKEAILRVKMAKEEAERTEVKAPSDGVVMGLAVTSPGTVIGQGGRLMEIVPQDDSLVIEAMVATFMIDKVHAGLEADIRFPALNQRTTPTLTGKVETVSPDRFVDTNNPNDPGYYKAKIVITPESLKKLDGVTLLAGMPAEVIIKTGHRTFFNYLAKPLVDRAAVSFKER
jgi:protease secretion system membrane fusion protein